MAKNNTQVDYLKKVEYDILLTICRYYDKHGYSPTYEQIIKDTGYSRATITKYLPALIQDGYLLSDRTPNGRVSTGSMIPNARYRMEGGTQYGHLAKASQEHLHDLAGIEQWVTDLYSYRHALWTPNQLHTLQKLLVVIDKLYDRLHELVVALSELADVEWED